MTIPASMTTNSARLTAENRLRQNRNRDIKMVNIQMVDESKEDYELTTSRTLTNF